MLYKLNIVVSKLLSWKRGEGKMPIKIKDMTLFSVSEVSQKLNVTTVTIRNYLRQGKLKGQKVMGRWFISEEDLVEFFEKPQ